MIETPSASDLFKAGKISAAEIGAAVEAVLARPETGPFPIADGYLLNLAAALRADKAACRALLDPTQDATLRRSKVEAAILLARPVKA